MKPERPFTTYRGTKRRGMGRVMHAHDEAQLTFAASGMVQAHTGEGRWLVPPQLAVWVPAGVQHRLELLTDAELWILHWRPSTQKAWAPPDLPNRPFALRVTPLLKALLAAAFAARTRPEKAELLVRLILHELTETSHAPTFLPLPTSLAGKRIADTILRAKVARQLHARSKVSGNRFRLRCAVR